MKNNEIHEGGCLCGDIRYKSEGEPKYVGVCHCRYCQLRTGSALGISVYFDNEQVTLVKGGESLKLYEYPTESGRSSRLRFCTNCGTALLWASDWRPGMLGVGGGTFDPPTFWYQIEREVFCRSKAEFINTGVEDKFDTGPVYEPINSEDIRLKGDKKPT